MTSKRIVQTNQQEKRDLTQGKGILQRAAVRAVSEAGEQSTEEKETQKLRNSAFSLDNSLVPVSTTKQQGSMTPVGSTLIQRKNKQATVESEEGGAIKRGQLRKRKERFGESNKDNKEHKQNKTGLPEKLKAGIENLSGLAMDKVRVHYNSPKPAELKALAYTQGTEIHVAPGQEEHLPHEGWHIVQQMQGRVKATNQIKGEEINNEEGMEREADVMGWRAKQLTLQKDEECQKEDKGKLTSQATGKVQLKIQRNNEENYQTWDEMEQWGEARKSTKEEAEKVILEVVSKLQEQNPSSGSEDERKKRSKDMWDQIVKDTQKIYRIDNNEGRQKLIDDAVKRINSSLVASGRLKVKKLLAQEIKDENNKSETLELEFTGGLTDMKVVIKNHELLEKLSGVPITRLPGQIATVILEGMTKKNKAVEVQAALSEDYKQLILSTNQDLENRKLEKKNITVEVIKRTSRKILKKKGYREMSRETANKDRVVRHAAKVMQRVGVFLDKSLEIMIPKKSNDNISDRHAEIRIEQDPRYKQDKFYLIQGTKYPCMACYLYFKRKKIEIGDVFGPMWVSDAALSTQLEEILGSETELKLTELTQTQRKEMARNIISELKKIVEENSGRMGSAKESDGKPNYKNKPDSDSEIEHDEFEKSKIDYSAMSTDSEEETEEEEIEEGELETESQDEEEKRTQNRERARLQGRVNTQRNKGKRGFEGIAMGSLEDSE